MKLNETIEVAFDAGIFQTIQNLNKFEWLTKDLAQDLDFEYYFNHSGEKSLSPMYERLLKLSNKGEGTILRRYAVDDDSIRQDDDDDINMVILDNYNVNPLSKLADIIYSHYNDKWNRLYDAFIASTYKPLENYSMTETESSTSSGSNSNNSTNTSSQTGETKTATDLKTSTNSDVKTSTNSDVKTSTNSDVTATENSKVQTDNSTYGFNSTASVPTDSSVVSGNATDNIKKTTGSADNNYSHVEGDEADNYSHVEGDATDNYSHVEGSADSNKTNSSITESNSTTENGSSSGTQDRSLSRSGNIGVTTSQQMLESEIALRQYDFINQLFEDVDKILTKPMYNI